MQREFVNNELISHKYHYLNQRRHKGQYQRVKVQRFGNFPDSDTNIYGLLQFAFQRSVLVRAQKSRVIRPRLSSLAIFFAYIKFAKHNHGSVPDLEHH